MRHKLTSAIIFLVIAFAVVIGIARSVGGGSDTTSPANAYSAGSVASSTASKSPTTGDSATYTLAQVAEHGTATDCWTTINGGVYNLTPFVNQHPGGVANIIKVCGIDGTSLFTAQHGGERRPENELASLQIGTLAR